MNIQPNISNLRCDLNPENIQSTLHDILNQFVNLNFESLNTYNIRKFLRKMEKLYNLLYNMK